MSTFIISKASEWKNLDQRINIRSSGPLWKRKKYIVKCAPHFNEELNAKVTNFKVSHFSYQQTDSCMEKEYLTQETLRWFYLFYSFCEDR